MGALQMEKMLYPPKTTKQTATRPNFDAVPQMACLVTATILSQGLVGLEIKIVQKSHGMKHMTCALLPDTDFVIVRKN